MKAVYKLVDSKGRVYLPRELRDGLKLDCGDFVKLTAEEGQLSLRKVHLIEVGDQSPEAVEAYIAAAAAMPREKQVALAALLLEKQRKGE